MTYPVILGSMVVTAGVMILYFLRRGWFGQANLRVGAATKGLSLSNQTPQEGGDRTHTFKPSEPIGDAVHQDASPPRTAAA